MAPEEDYEGASLVPESSRYGAVHVGVRQLRDPAVYEEDRRLYLLYSCAGENAIAIAELTPRP
jgi:hypothetical protein